MLKIWGRDNSNNVRKVLWAAEELGLTYEHVPAGGAFGVNNEPAYREMNPNGLVPCIDDGGFILWESNAIVRYLAATYGTGTLWPENPAARAIGDKWMDWTSTTFAPAFRDIFWNLLRVKPAERDHAAMERSAARSGELLSLVDAALGKQPCLSGADLGIGDIAFGPFAYSWFGLPVERPDHRYLKAWYDRMCERPAFRKGVMTALN